MNPGSSPGRCDWCLGDPLYIAYHDSEWGRPCRDEKRLFEFLLLEGAQAGLSWITILRKRENYRAAYSDFDPAKLAAYGDRDIDRLCANPGIVRNRQKIKSAIGNARAFLALQAAGQSFSELLWSFVDGQPIQNRWRRLSDVPAQTELSTAMSRTLRQAGFNFVGPTICYAFMQATGMVNDHLLGCDWRERCAHPEASA